jgi:hypothetical protein
MSEKMRVFLEIGPKGKNVVAVAPDWPGLTRGAKTADEAVERLRTYIPRYALVAKLAGMDKEFAVITDVAVAGEYPGVGSTDFWGISFAFSEFDRGEITNEALERELALLRGAWAYFDGVRPRVSAELQKGPRGGGRDRDQIIRHTLFSETDMSKKVGVRTPFEEMLTENGLRAHRDAYCDAIRAYHAEGKMARTWPLRYLIRHTTFHSLDHVWEMEDKDLTAASA